MKVEVRWVSIKELGFHWILTIPETSIKLEDKISSTTQFHHQKFLYMTIMKWFILQHKRNKTTQQLKDCTLLRICLALLTQGIITKFAKFKIRDTSLGDQEIKEKRRIAVQNLWRLLKVVESKAADQLKTYWITIEWY